MGAIARTFEPGIEGVYDSAHRESPVARELRELWSRRGLLRLLVARDVVLRYKRSLLGVWWALLNPLLRLGVIWLVMASVFRPRLPGVPYLVYLFSGIVVITFFDQAVVSAGSSIVTSSGILTQLYVPPLSFAVSAVLAAGVTLLVGLIPMGLVQLATGVGIPWTMLLLPIPLLSLAALAAGFGLMLASLAVRFYDAIDMSAILLQLLAFATPTFYPIEAIPASFRWIIELNPLTQIVMLFRAYAYQGQLGSWQTILACGGSSALVLALGILVFARTWTKAAVLL
jgi:ABC-2 type transport system permease protein